MANGLYLCRRRPTLPHTFACSTIGPAWLDFRVRDGNGYFPRGKITGFVDVGPPYGWPLGPSAWVTRRAFYVDLERALAKWCGDLSQLNSIRMAWLKPCLFKVKAWVPSFRTNDTLHAPLPGW